MSSYEVEIPGVGIARVSKKPKLKSLRISLSPKGEILVSAPYSLPKIAISHYLNSKKEWILENIPSYVFEPYSGMKFGENLTLFLYQDNDKQRSRLISNSLHVYLDRTLDLGIKSQLEFIEKRMINALKNEAEAILLPRLNKISKNIDVEFNQAYVKKLKGRWGSCDKNKNIILNIFLLQLPIELQHYVIVHELAHTKHMNHSKEFWGMVGNYLPEFKKLRKELKTHQPRLEERK